MADVFARPDRGARGPAPERSRPEIAAVAIALADGGGLGAATMRAIATEMGTGAGALYRYVTSRAELLTLMVDAALAELARPAPTGDWLADLIAVAHRLLALYQRHPWMIEATPLVTSMGPHTVDYFDHCLAILSGLDRGAGAKMAAIGVMTGVITLFARTTPAVSFDGLTPARHPHLAAAFASPGEPPPPDLFGRTLRAVLTGLLA